MREWQKMNNRGEEDPGRRRTTAEQNPEISYLLIIIRKTKVLLLKLKYCLFISAIVIHFTLYSSFIKYPRIYFKKRKCLK